MERKEQGTVQALERGLKILELLMQEKRPMGVNEIAKCQGITPSAPASSAALESRIASEVRYAPVQA